MGVNILNATAATVITGLIIHHPLSQITQWLSANIPFNEASVINREGFYCIPLSRRHSIHVHSMGAHYNTSKACKCYL